MYTDDPTSVFLQIGARLGRALGFVQTWFLNSIDRFVGWVMNMRDYDLPLRRERDSHYLVLLVAMMSFLAVLACTGFFALSAMTDRWTSGLENKVTVEIPAQSDEGAILSKGTIDSFVLKIQKILMNSDAVESFNVLDEAEIRELLAPWMGGEIALGDIPLPGLIAVELKDVDPQYIDQLESNIRSTVRGARMDRHQDWLQDLIRFVSVLQFIALVVVLIIGMTTTAAIAGGVLSRMAIYREEVELLHLIGAQDHYIARQFQRYGMVLTLQGSIIGTLAGLLVTISILMLSGHSGTSLIPAIQLGIGPFLFLLLLPVIACAIGATTARFTVLRALGLMP